MTYFCKTDFDVRKCSKMSKIQLFNFRIISFQTAPEENIPNFGRVFRPNNMAPETMKRSIVRMFANLKVKCMFKSNIHVVLKC